MDADRFDAVSRSLGRLASRRSVVGVVAAAFAPLTTAAAPAPARCLPVGKRCTEHESDAAARRRGRGKGKHGGKHHPPSCAKCCSRAGAAGADGKARCTCKREGIDCDHPSQCCGGLCRNGVCNACPDDFAICADGCADLQTDRRHCGACDKACDPGLNCQDGSCVCDEASCPAGCIDAATCSTPCPAGLTLCNGQCVPTQTDPLNCGGCGKRCPVNESCVGGACVCGALGHSAAPSTCCSTDGVCVQAAPDADTFLKPDPCAFVDVCPSGYTACIASTDSGCRACCPPDTTCVGGADGGYCLQGAAAAASRSSRRRRRRERSGRGGRRR